MTNELDAAATLYRGILGWSRTRTLVLAALVVFGCATLAAWLPRPEYPNGEVGLPSDGPPPNKPSALRSSSGRAWTETVVDCRNLGRAGPIAWPGARVDLVDDSWIASDAMGVERTVVGDAQGVSIESLHGWASRICDPHVHTVVLSGFSEATTADTIAEALVESCPSLRVRWGWCTACGYIGGCY